MAVAVDGPPVQPGMAVARLSGPTAPPQPFSEQELEAKNQKCFHSFDEPEPEAEDSQSCGPKWKPEADCDGLSAKMRAMWLVKNKEMSAEEAKIAVMKEFPTTFL